MYQNSNTPMNYSAPKMPNTSSYSSNLDYISNSQMPQSYQPSLEITTPTYSSLDQLFSNYSPMINSTSTYQSASPNQFGIEPYVIALTQEIENLHERISGLEQSMNNQIIDFHASSQVTRPTPFVKGTDHILPLVKEAFEAVTNKELQDNFSLHILPKNEFKRAHEFFNGKYTEGVMGFCINKNGKDQNSIFIKEGELAQVLLTIGHEIGHLQSNSLDPINEEAKAFAFTIAWMHAIKNKNIGNLADVIIPIRPAKNGLHNVALTFVLEVMKLGKSAHTTFQDIISGVTRYKDLYTFNTGNYHDLL